MKIEVPTILSEQGNVQLRALYRKHYGIDLTEEEANIEGNRIMTFMAIVFENSKQEYEN